MRNEEDLLQMSEVIRSLAERMPLVTEPNVIQVIDNPGFETKPPMTKTTVPAELGAATATTETAANQSPLLCRAGWWPNIRKVALVGIMNLSPKEQGPLG